MSPTSTFYAATAALIVVIACLKLVYFERWLLDNDNYIVLSTFFSASGHPDYVKSARRFYDASVASCDPQNKRCIAYAGAIQGQQTYARPLIALAGSFLPQPKWLTTDFGLLEGVAKATVWQVAASTAVAVTLLLCFLLLLPRSVSAFMAGMMALLGIAAYSLPEHPALAKFQLLLGVNVATAAGVPIAALAIWLYARTAVQRPEVLSESLSSERVINLFWAAALLLLALRVAAAGFPTLYFGGAMLGRAGIFITLLSLAGMAVFLAAMALTTARHGTDIGALWISVFLLFGFVTTGEGLFTTAFHIAPRGYIYLLAVPIMVYVALRPSGWAIWLIPALAVFHISVAGLLCGCVLATEIIAGLRRRSISIALVLSAAVLIAAALHTGLITENPIIAASANSLASILSRVSMLSFAPGAAVFGVLLYGGYLAWRMPDPAGDFFLRAIVLAALLAGAGQLREVLESAGYDLMDPVAYNFVLLSYYLAPMVCGAGMFLVILGFAASTRNFDKRDLALNPKSVSLVAAGVLALVAARGDNSVGKPPNPFVAMARGLTLMVTQQPPASIDARVIEAAAPNDRYLVGPHPGDTITMTSILKMKARSAAGLLNPDNVSVAVIKRGSPQ